MANKTVVIACDEQGQYSVGEEPKFGPATGDDMLAEANSDAGVKAEPAMEPVESLDAALERARAMFAESEDGMPKQADGSPSPFEAPAAMKRGFDKVRGATGY